MTLGNHLLSWTARACVAVSLLAAACAPAASPSPTAAPAKPAATTAPAKTDSKAAETKPAAQAGAETLDQLYEKAKAEGGKVVFYGTLAQVNAEKILPMFEQRFPGMDVEHIDATSDKLAARAISEARGGQTFGDVFQTPIDVVVQMHDQKLLAEWSPPEAAAYPDTLKGSFWVASDLQFWIPAWNTDQVQEGEAPRTFEDFADPKWQGRIIAEPRDHDILLALAEQKYKSQDQAVELMRKIAANNVEFHDGHSEIAELLVAGQAAATFTGYSHHYPPRIEKGAPVGYSTDEGVGTITATAVFNNAPHPNSAQLFARWVVSEEGQKAYAQGGRTPAHPNVEPTAKTRPDTAYFLTADALPRYAEYEKLWKEIFNLR